MPHDTRQPYLRFPNGPKAPLPFSAAEYARRLAALRAIMAEAGVEAAVLTSMHGIAYHSGFLYCAFGRPFALVVDRAHATVVAPMIDAGQPGRRAATDHLTYTDWRRDSFQAAVASLVGGAKRVGIEGDHLTLAARDALAAKLPGAALVDIAPATMRARMIKSAEEIALITDAARIADLGGAAMRAAIRPGQREIDVAMEGRDAMEREIARAWPETELRDTWVWFQSGLNTDGAHNPVTTRRLAAGDLLSLNAFPMLAGYYVALERSLFLGEPDAATLRYWNANVAAHELGQSLIRPGVRCSEVCAGINEFLEGEGMLGRRSFGYGHSFGVLSHYYGREAGLELREDIETVLAPCMVVSMEPMLTVPEGEPGAGGYREHDILVVTETGAVNITGFPYGPDANVIAA